MHSVKRSYSSSKSSFNRHNGKVKEANKSISKYKSYEMNISDNDSSTPCFPIVKQIDNSRVLPRYTTVLGRSVEDGVGMEDLDQLQQDLEKLLSNCAVRNRLLRSEIELIDRVDDGRDNKKGKPHDKRKRVDDKPKYDTKNEENYNFSISNYSDLTVKPDLSKKLSNFNNVRNRLRSEIESADRTDDKRDNKKSKSYDKQATLKRKRPDDKTKYKDSKNGVRFLKTKYNLPINNFVNDIPVKHEVPKVTFPKNDTSDKFWLSIEPYCTDVTKDDVAFIDELIHECSQDIDVKIPEVGDHYATEWSEEMLAQEQNLGTAGRSVKNKTISINNELKKNGLNAMVDTFSSPLTQRLLAALIEEKVMTKFPTVTDKLKLSDVGLLKSPNVPRGGACLDKRLRKELVDQGILDVEDLPKSIPAEDDILLEIKKCQQELSVVNEHNVGELNKLRTIIAKDQRRQEVKEALNKVDNQVMEMYNKILVAKQKQSYIGFEKNVFPKQNLREFEAAANSIIKQQIILHRELNELTDMALPQ